MTARKRGSAKLCGMPLSDGSACENPTWDPTGRCHLHRSTVALPRSQASDVAADMGTADAVAAFLSDEKMDLGTQPTQVLPGNMEDLRLAALRAAQHPDGHLKYRVAPFYNSGHGGENVKCGVVECEATAREIALVESSPSNHNTRRTAWCGDKHETRIRKIVFAGRHLDDTDENVMGVRFSSAHASDDENVSAR